MAKHTCPHCGDELEAKTVKKEGPNKGKGFITCPCAGRKGSYFEWLNADGEIAGKKRKRVGEDGKPMKKVNMELVATKIDGLVETVKTLTEAVKEHSKVLQQ